MLKQQEREKELDCHRFCSYSINDILGISIESEYLYIIQNSKISVYEYHGKNDIPQLSEQLIHNKLIQNYSLNKYYICICSASLLEIRDRKHWENVLYTYSVTVNQSIIGVVLDQHSIYIAKKDNGCLIYQKIDVEARQIVSNINLGKVNQSSIQILKTIKPIFLNNLGMLNDFYIWPKTNKKVQLGMLYAGQGISKMKFQINQIQINDGLIKQVFHHRINCIKYPNQSTEYVVIVIEKNNKEIYLHFYQIASKPIPPKKDKEDEEEFQGKLKGIINQFSFLKNLNQRAIPNSLVQEVFNQAIIANEGEQKLQTHFQIKLNDLSTYESSYLLQGKIWIVCEQKLCEIELTNEQNIQNIIKNNKIQQTIIKSVNYHNKPKNKQFIGLYKQKQLFTQLTTSFDIAFNRQANQQIAQEIQQYQVNDQILDKEEAEIRIIEEAEKNVDDFIKKSLDQKSKEKVQEKINSQDYNSQTEQLSKQTKQCATQTTGIQSKPIPIGLQAIQDLVAKYSSSVSVSCTKVKQNTHIKDKFDRQISNIVDSIVKDSVKPYLQSKFISQLDQKIQDITKHITTVFQTQLEGLNQFVRKNQVKESNLRGRRIFQFSRQINQIKETVSIITDTLKANQLQKNALNELILDEAKEMKTQITKISTSVLQLDQKNQVYEKQLNGQIGEIFQLIKTLQEKQKQNMQDSECEREESEDESEQREIDQTSEQQNVSVDSKQEFQREQMHYRYPPYNHYAVRGVQESKRNKKPLQSLDKQGYTPYPSPQYYHAPTQMPYYYPFMPQIPSVPIHGYYPNYSYPVPPHKQEIKNAVKKGKASKKNKKVDE